MDQIHGNMDATTLWVWYDLITGGSSDHDGIKNEATTQSLKTTGSDQTGETIIAQWMTRFW